MAGYDIISRLNSKFTSAVQDRESPDYLTRDIGGQFRRNQPYISGYFQVWFGLPERMFQGPNAAAAANWLHSTCENFTPHGQTINAVDVPGIGQTGSSFYTGMTTTREFSLSFREYQNMPVINVIRTWAASFDPHIGVSPLRGNEFLPTAYKGWCAVCQLKPTRGDDAPLGVDDIEEAYIYQGVFPKSVPVDTVSQSDIQANDTVQLNVSFSFDGHPLTSADEGVVEKVLSFFTQFKYIDTFRKYNQFVGS